jgi:hypothetical protein
MSRILAGVAVIPMICASESALANWWQVLSSDEVSGGRYRANRTDKSQYAKIGQITVAWCGLAAGNIAMVERIGGVPVRTLMPLSEWSSCCFLLLPR